MNFNEALREATHLAAQQKALANRLKEKPNATIGEIIRQTKEATCEVVIPDETQELLDTISQQRERVYTFPAGHLIREIERKRKRIIHMAECNNYQRHLIRRCVDQILKG